MISTIERVKAIVNQSQKGAKKTADSNSFCCYRPIVELLGFIRVFASFFMYFVVVKVHTSSYYGPNNTIKGAIAAPMLFTSVMP